MFPLAQHSVMEQRMPPAIVLYQWRLNRQPHSPANDGNTLSMPNEECHMTSNTNSDGEHTDMQRPEELSPAYISGVILPMTGSVRWQS